MTIKIKNYLTNNSVYYSKSFISDDIVKKMYKEIINISNNIQNTIKNLFKNNSANLYEKKLQLMMVYFLICITPF